eukprot:2713628-Rhodomonas_salina.1
MRPPDTQRWAAARSILARTCANKPGLCRCLALPDASREGPGGGIASIEASPDGEALQRWLSCNATSPEGYGHARAGVASFISNPVGSWLIDTLTGASVSVASALRCSSSPVPDAPASMPLVPR